MTAVMDIWRDELAASPRETRELQEREWRDYADEATAHARTAAAHIRNAVEALEHLEAGLRCRGLPLMSPDETHHTVTDLMATLAECAAEIERNDYSAEGRR